MKIPTAAILGILIAGVSTLAGPPERRLHTTHRHHAASGRGSKESLSRPGQPPVLGLIYGILGFRFLLHCSMRVEEIVTLSCRAQVGHSRGST